MLGVGADWPINPAWMVKASYIYVSNQGEATFSSVNNYGNPLNIGNFDDTKQQYFNLKANYTLNKSWSFSGGYAYEKYSRDDIGAANYTNIVPQPYDRSPRRQGDQHASYLNGYNLNPNGNQNIFFLIGDVPVRRAAASGRAAAGPEPPKVVRRRRRPPPPPPRRHPRRHLSSPHCPRTSSSRSTRQC